MALVTVKNLGSEFSVKERGAWLPLSLGNEKKEVMDGHGGSWAVGVRGEGRRWDDHDIQPPRSKKSLFSTAYWVSTVCQARI